MIEKTIDWVGIEVDYRCGVMTLRSIAEKYGVAHGSITKRAKRDGWARDLTERVRLKREELVYKKAASKEASKKELRTTEVSRIEQLAESQSNIIMQERDDVAKARLIVSTTFDNLEKDKCLELPQKIECIKKLTEAMKTAIGLERQVYGIADNANGEANKPSLADVANMTPADAYRAMLA